MMGRKVYIYIFGCACAQSNVYFYCFVATTATTTTKSTLFYNKNHTHTITHCSTQHNINIYIWTLVVCSRKLKFKEKNPLTLPHTFEALCSSWRSFEIRLARIKQEKLATHTDRRSVFDGYARCWALFYSLMAASSKTILSTNDASSGAFLDTTGGIFGITGVEVILKSLRSINRKSMISLMELSSHWRHANGYYYSLIRKTQIKKPTHTLYSRCEWMKIFQSI